MVLPKPHSGLVIAYDYLWHDPRRRFADSTARLPGAVVLAVADEGGERIVTAAPLVAGPPADPREAVELPAATCRRLGLAETGNGDRASDIGRHDGTGNGDANARAAGPVHGPVHVPAHGPVYVPIHVDISEVNRFVWPGPDLRAVATRSASAFVYGVLPPRLFKRITAQLIASWRARDSQ
jgi:hypothetical protein